MIPTGVGEGEEGERRGKGEGGREGERRGKGEGGRGRGEGKEREGGRGRGSNKGLAIQTIITIIITECSHNIPQVVPRISLKPQISRFNDFMKILLAINRQGTP